VKAVQASFSSIDLSSLGVDLLIEKLFVLSPLFKDELFSFAGPVFLVIFLPQGIWFDYATRCKTGRQRQ